MNHQCFHLHDTRSHSVGIFFYATAHKKTNPVQLHFNYHKYTNTNDIKLKQVLYGKFSSPQTKPPLQGVDGPSAEV